MQHTETQEVTGPHELAFSERNRLRRMALRGLRGLLALRYGEPRNAYVDEIRAGLDLCSEFEKGYELTKKKSPDSLSDLPLWNAFQQISSQPMVRKASLQNLVERVAEIEKTLSLVVAGQRKPEEQSLDDCRTFLLDAVDFLW